MMPTAQFDAFEHLDKPLMTPERRERTFRVWDQLSNERDHYLDGVDTALAQTLKADTPAS